MNVFKSRLLIPTRSAPISRAILSPQGYALLLNNLNPSSLLTDIDASCSVDKALQLTEYNQHQVNELDTLDKDQQ